MSCDAEILSIYLSSLLFIVTSLLWISHSIICDLTWSGQITQIFVFLRTNTNTHASLLIWVQHKPYFRQDYWHTLLLGWDYYSSTAAEWMKEPKKLSDLPSPRHRRLIKHGGLQSGHLKKGFFIKTIFDEGWNKAYISMRIMISMSKVGINFDAK